MYVVMHIFYINIVKGEKNLCYLPLTDIIRPGHDTILPLFGQLTLYVTYKEDLLNLLPLPPMIFRLCPQPLHPESQIVHILPFSLFFRSKLTTKTHDSTVKYSTDVSRAANA